MVQEQVKLLRLLEQYKKKMAAADPDDRTATVKINMKIQLIQRKLQDLDTGEPLQYQQPRVVHVTQIEEPEAEDAGME